MNEINDVSKILQSVRNKYVGYPLPGLALETFKKFGIDLEALKNEVTILNFEMVDYEEKNKYSVFGEKESISYILQFTIYNIEFVAKLLTFEYETKSEVLKLDLSCNSPSLSKEMKYCCNLLRRRRNLNLMFITLISFARYLESRRLVCDLILRKTRNVKIEENKDGGKIVVYSDKKRNIKLGIFWTVECNSEHEIIDKLEIYYKAAELPKRRGIKYRLTQLTEPHLEFSEKYHLWADLLKCLSDNSSSVIIVDSVAKAGAQKRSYSRECSEVRSEETCSSSEDISIIRHPRLVPSRLKVKKEEPNNDNDNDHDEDVAIISSTRISTLPNESNPLVCIKNPKFLSKNSKEASILLSDTDESEEQVENMSKCYIQNDKKDHIIYIDSLDDKNTTSTPGGAGSSCTITSSSSSNRTGMLNAKPGNTLNNIPQLASFQATGLRQSSNATDNLLPLDEDPKIINSINLTESDTESVISLSPDVEEKQESMRDNSIPNCCSHNRSSVINTSVVCNLARDFTCTPLPFIPNVKSSSNVTGCDFVVPPKKPKIVDDDLEITGITYVVPD